VSFADSGADTGAEVLHLRYVTVVVKDYDEALAWYTNVLGLSKVEDRDFGHGRRWIVVAPQGQTGLGIVLDTAAPASMDSSSPAKANRIGKETNWVFQVSSVPTLKGTMRLSC
jgi:catechol 2,3-dioxygenase-like lactoylglutathione lyase family enzyme